jgi:hypothetical protein
MSGFPSDASSSSLGNCIRGRTYLLETTGIEKGGVSP